MIAPGRRPFEVLQTSYVFSYSRRAARAVNAVDKQRTPMDIPRPARARPWVRAISGTATLALALALAACGNHKGGATTGTYGFPELSQDDNATITVWVDADRSPAVDAFKKANPDVKLNVVSYDGSANGSNSFRT